MSRLEHAPRWPGRREPLRTEERVERAADRNDLCTLVIVVGVIGAIWLMESGAISSWVDRLIAPIVVFVDLFLRAITGLPAGYAQ